MKASDYKCVIFDLDHTLWDYDLNCAEALNDLYHKYELQSKGASSYEHFLAAFIELNVQMWDQFDLGLIQRDVIRYQRFHRVLMKLGIDDYRLSLELSSDYVALSPTKKNLMPNARVILEYLKDKYPLLIITNGFEEIQSIKLSSSGIDQYFQKVFTSESVGHKKPAKEIFEVALKHGDFRAHETLMIGDNLNTDIKGADNAKIDSVFFNPEKKTHAHTVKYEISDLLELKSIL